MILIMNRFSTSKVLQSDVDLLKIPRTVTAKENIQIPSRGSSGSDSTLPVQWAQV